jgi:hypothetical protein
MDQMLESRESFGEIIGPDQTGDLAERLSQQVTRYLVSPQEFARDDDEQPQRDSNPCRHLERVVS